MKLVRLILPASILACALAAYLAFSRDDTPAPLQTPKPVRTAVGDIYGKWCSDCHSTAGGPGSVALQRKYQGAVPAILEQRTDLNPDYVRLVVRKGMSFMPSFRKTEISDAELTLLADYLAPAPEATKPSNNVDGSED